MTRIGSQPQDLASSKIEINLLLSSTKPRQNFNSGNKDDAICRCLPLVNLA